MQNFTFKILNKATGKQSAILIILATDENSAYEQVWNMLDGAIFKPVIQR